MKKILLLSISVLIAGSLTGQSLSLLFGGSDIPHGATVQVVGDPADEYIQARASVKNNSNTDIEVKVKKIIHAGDTLSNTINYFCWGVCFPPFIYTPEHSLMIGPGQVNDTSFYGDYIPNGVIGISRISYVFYDTDNRNDSVALTVEYNASPASTGENMLSRIKFTDAYPNPAAGVVNIDYQLPVNTRKASIIVTNILGSRVKEVQLTSLSGKASIPVSDMTNGIYFYSLNLDDHLVITRKFVVKR